MDLTPSQVIILERFLRASFHFVTLEHMERFIGVERNGFVALLDPSEGKLKPYGQSGYRMGRGIGMLVDLVTGKAFVWKGESIPASPGMLAGYDAFRAEVKQLLSDEPQQ